MGALSGRVNDCSISDIPSSSATSPYINQVRSSSDDCILRTVRFRGGKVCRHTLEHNRESVKLFKCSRLTDDILPRVPAASLDSKASVGMHGLRLEPYMAHHRYTALDHSLNYILMSVHALELDSVCAGDHQD